MNWQSLLEVYIHRKCILQSLHNKEGLYLRRHSPKRSILALSVIPGVQ